MSNNIDRQYLELVNHILRFGYDKQDRTGTGTKSIFGWQIRHRMSEGFPLLTTKKMAWKTMVTELLWFLKGRTDLRYLLDNDCYIWVGDAYKRFLNETIKVEPADAKQRAVSQLLNNKESQEEFINKIKTDDEFAKKWGDLGPVYGRQWRSWKKPNHLTGPCEDEFTTDLGFISKEEYEIQKDLYVIDQIQNIINDLKTNPDSRRMIVNAYNVGELDQMVLPPCHMMFQFYTRELSSQERKNIYDKSSYVKDIFPTDENGWNKLFDECNVPTRAISLMYYARSQDVPLGTPFNISSYSLLLMIIAKHVNMVPEELIANMGDCHIYNNQIEGIKEQLTRIPYDLPTVRISDRIVNDISEYEVDDFVLENYQYHPSIKLPLSN